MTEQEHDSLYPLSRIMIADNYIKVDTLLKRLGSMYPDDTYAVIGTVPERLAHLLGRLTGDPTMFADMVYSIETPNADDVACAETPYPYHLVSCRQGRTELVPMPSDFDGISKGDLALVCMYGYKSLPADHPLRAYGSTSAVPTTMDRYPDWVSSTGVRYYWDDVPILPIGHTPMAYDHTMIAPFIDLINETGHIGHTPIGTIVEDSTNE
jgi:hypothetical protein